MKPLIVKVFFYTDAQLKLKELGVDDEIPLSKCDLREVTFYTINALSEYKEEGEEEVELCAIYSNGNNYIANMAYENAKKHVES